MMPTCARLIELSDSETALAIRAAVYILAARLALRFIALPRLLTSLTRAGSQGHRQIDPSRIEKAVHRASRHLPGTGCLPEAIALHNLLRRSGVPARFRIGVAKQGPSVLVAHAWVDFPAADNEPQQSEAGRYAVILDHPPADASRL